MYFSLLLSSVYLGISVVRYVCVCKSEFVICWQCGLIVTLQLGHHSFHSYSSHTCYISGTISHSGLFQMAYIVIIWCAFSVHLVAGSSRSHCDYHQVILPLDIIICLLFTVHILGPPYFYFQFCIHHRSFDLLL
jgi:hypothetical protein